MSFLLDLLKKLFGFGRSTSGPLPDPEPDSNIDDLTEPAQITNNRVLLLIYDPVMNTNTGEKLSQRPGWRSPDELVVAFSAEIIETSYGMARYEIVERIEVDGFPVLPDEIGGDRFGLASVHRKDRALFCLFVITGRDVERRHGAVLPGLYLGCLDQNVERLAAGEVADQLEGIVGGLLEQALGACLEPRNHIDDLRHTCDLEHVALAQEDVQPLGHN